MTMPDETLVRETLHHAVDDLSAPVDRLTSAALLGGGRLRRRRRALKVAGALGTAVLVAVPTAVLLGGTGHAPTSSHVATDPSPSVVQSSGSVEPTPAMVDNDAWARMPAKLMAGVLSADLPGALHVTDVPLLNPDPAPGEEGQTAHGYLTGKLLDGDTVVGGVNALLYVTGLSPDRFSCPGNLTSITSCAEIRDNSGQLIGRRSVTTTGAVIVNEVIVEHVNGGFVYLAASNSADDKPGAGSSTVGTTVPLTLDQLQTIAQDEAWTAWEPSAGG